MFISRISIRFEKKQNLKRQYKFQLHKLYLHNNDDLNQIQCTWLVSMKEVSFIISPLKPATLITLLNKNIIQCAQALTSSMPGILLTESFFNVVCTFLPSVVAVLCTTFFFLLAVPYKKWLIYLELKYMTSQCVNLFKTTFPYSVKIWEVQYNRQVARCMYACWWFSPLYLTVS